MISKFQITRELLVRNTLVNFIGQAVPLLVSVIIVPFIIRGLGTERFGLLSLAWVILGYFSIFDLGLGRATTKFVAEALSKSQDDEIPRLVWTSVAVQLILGIVGTIVLIGITPLLAERILKIPQELVGEAKSTFYLLAFSVPVVLVSGSFRGILEAAQRFDLVNAISIPSSVLSSLLFLTGVLLSFSLPGIVALILVARVGALAAFITLNLHIMPRLRRYSSSFFLFPRLFYFGGWVTVTSIVSPVLVYLDRFLISSFLSMSAVAYYIVPYEAVTRLWIIAGSLTMTLFPAFSALEGVKDRQRLGFLFARAVKYILLVLGPIVLIIGLFAENILQVWLGVEFAVKSAVVLQILAFGVLINSLAHIPYVLLQGAGRPDLTAKFHLLELPFYIGTVWLLISSWGINGVAAAWILRVVLDALLLFGATFKIYSFSLRLFIANGVMFAGFALLLFGGMAYGVKTLAGALLLSIQLVPFIAIFSLFAWFVWRKALDTSDKDAILKMVKSRQYIRSML